MISKLASLPLLAIVSCDTIVTPTQTITLPQQGSQGSASPSPAPVALAPGAFDQVVVEIFEATCPLPLTPGCIARITATPKSRGVQVGPEVHGPNCSWFLNGAPISGIGSTPVVQVARTTNAFNLNVVTLTQGTFTLEVEVMGVRGSRTFVVQ